MTDQDNKWVEKRSHPRIPRQFIIRARIHDDGNQRWEMPILKDISLAGCYFYSGVHFGKEQLLDIEVQLPVIQEPLRCLGKVKRVEPKSEAPDAPCGIAVEFLEVEESKKQKFQEVVAFTLKRLQQQ